MVQWRLPRFRSWRFALFYGLFVGVPVAAGVEITVRLMHLAPPLNYQFPGMVPAPYLPYRPAPHGVWMSPSASGEFSFETRHSSLGIRDVEHSAKKPPGTFRILGLGDSFTYGTGAAFEDTYLVRLEGLLNRRPGAHPKIEIIKAGIPRYFPEPERLFLEHYGLAFEPDLVILTFVPNDVIDTQQGLDAVKPTDDGFLMTREASELGGLGHWFFLHSHAARMVLTRWVAHRIWAKSPIFGDDVFVANGRHEKAWRRVEEEYRRMADLAGHRGARLVIVHIPDHGSWDRPGASYPATRLSAWAAANGAFFIDTMPALAAASSSEKLYWDIDPHCNAAGYRVVAEAVSRGLAEHGLVP
ncbi:MAG TPA: SGNH/GDSL hydrolase family protein [Thermoanaerobaculia bacterium]|jgi:lysophospholipase L1-like esterase|nr:SGNH/GDSL hydrolase family protein [Thermoanaerobaculia bacterium]